MNRRPVPPARSPALAFALLTAMAVVATAAFLGPAGAQTSGCSPIDRSGTECRIDDIVNPARPTPGGGAVMSSASPPGPRFVWLNLLLACEASGGSSWSSQSDLDTAITDLAALAAATPPTEPGVLWIGELIDPASGPTGSGFISCVGDGDARPPLPPPIPTAAQIWGAALTFDPAVNLDPYVRGLTGLETFMWYEGLTADSVVLTLNGYSVSADVSAIEFRWDMGAEDRGGAQEHRTSVPGSADDPAASHTYALPGPVVVIHDIVWTGSSVVTGPGIPAGGISIDLGQAILSTARDYDVIEVRTPVVRG